MIFSVGSTTVVGQQLQQEQVTTEKIRRPRLRLSLDWASLLVALVAAAAVRFGLIGSVPW